MATEHSDNDQVHRYLFERLHCRGELVQLNQTINQVFATAQYTLEVKQLLAELMSATALLTATLKFSGDITLQIQGDGPISYLSVNANDRLEMRAMARQSSIPASSTLADMVGKAILVITIAPTKGERYQGMVEVDSKSVATTLENYFQQSEQLATKIWFAHDINDSDSKAAGIMLQTLPTSDQSNQYDLEHLVALTDTVKDQELLELDSNTLLTRLYHQDNPQLFSPQQVCFKCGCSEEKIARALLNIPLDELLQQIAEQGELQVDCQFCLKRYQFNSEQVRQIHQQSH